MAKTQYEMRKAESGEILSEIDLLPQIAHKVRQFYMALFGPNIYQRNVESMGKQYFHSCN